MLLSILFLILQILEIAAFVIILKKIKPAKAPKVLAIFAFAAVFLFTVKLTFTPPATQLKTTGRFAVESLEYWVTENGRDPFAQNESLREVQVQAWFPKTEKSEKPEAVLPVVIFSHGSFGTIDNNLSLYKELASNGYVVLALAHPYHAATAKLSSGKTVSVSPQFIKEGTALSPAENPDAAFETYASWMNIRMGDMNCVMDDFVKKAESGDFEFCKYGDKNRFVVAGHSLGGAAAYGIARIRSDVAACIALESPFLYDIKGVKNQTFIFDDSPYQCPLLNIYTDSTYSHLAERKEYQNNVKFLNCENCTNIYYHGAGHLTICDLGLYSPLLARLLGGKSKGSAKKYLEQLNKDCLNFLQNL